ncbi:hypothetical protein PVIIG_05403 [Plasmodium vivax India VII]|uniref:VIR protein n=1 Tax=Plasmodium vivax India VII TaxID=1077284 RepID=A0A0J9S259_PLAVI|nr:hypothetical protein PVIIG_05403 [Plasmodium vivax India VII]
MYEIFDKPMSSEDGNQDILNSCDKDSTFNSNPTVKQKNTCKKLLRNLLLCNDPNSFVFMKCCNDLYIWLYFEIKKYRLSNNIIKNIFTLPNLENDRVPKPNYCLYFSFNDNLHKPEDLIKLRIFNDNIDKFHNLLNNTDNSRNCFFKMYFYECVNTYIYLNGQFCSEGRQDIANNKDNCKIVRDFSTLYTSFYQVASMKGYELPYLYSSNPYNVISCTIEGTNNESSSTASNNSNKSISRTVPTAIGLILFVLKNINNIEQKYMCYIFLSNNNIITHVFFFFPYKFTPVGTMFKSNKKKHTNVFNNIDEEIEKELFYPRSKNGIINSSLPRYSVAYEPV